MRPSEKGILPKEFSLLPVSDEPCQRNETTTETTETMFPC